MKQRLAQYDIMKGIGILLVILCHAGLGGYSKEFIYTFHMPLFFFASGCFFKDSSFGSYLQKNVKQLLIPYLFFVLCMIIARHLRSSDIHSFMTSFSGAVTSLNPLDESDRYLYESIWFLICLFNVRLFYWMVNRASKGVLWIKVAICVLLYICGFLLHKASINIPFFIDTAFSVLVFYALGEVFHKKGFDNQNVPWLAVLIGFTICLLCCYWFHPSVELKDNCYPFYLVLLSSIMIVALYYISKSLSFVSEKRKTVTIGFLNKAGVSSLCILGLHNQFFLIIGPHLRRIPTPPSLDILILILMCLITAVLIIYIEKLINRFTPFLLGKF